MRKSFLVIGGFLAVTAISLLIGAAAPAPIYRNQWTTNVPGQAVIGGGTLAGSFLFDSALGVGSGGNIITLNPGTMQIVFNSANVGDLGIFTGGGPLGGGDTTVSGWLSVSGKASVNGLNLTNNSALSFSTNATVSDLFLQRGFTPNSLDQRNGTAPQTNAIYNTFTDSGNYEKVETAWDNNNLFIGRVQKAGTGSLRNVFYGNGSGQGDTYFSSGSGRTTYFRRSATVDWSISSSGHLTAGTDNTPDIGQTNASRPRIIYVASGLVLGASGSILTNILTGRANLDFPSTAASSSSDLSITVTGATTNDVASVQAPPITQLANSTFTCFASNNAVYVRFSNYQTVGNLDPGAASFSVIVHRF